MKVGLTCQMFRDSIINKLCLGGRSNRPGYGVTQVSELFALLWKDFSLKTSKYMFYNSKQLHTLHI